MNQNSFCAPAYGQCCEASGQLVTESIHCRCEVVFCVQQLGSKPVFAKSKLSVGKATIVLDSQTLLCLL